MRKIAILIFTAVLLGIFACSGGARRNGIPPAAQAVLDSAIQDIDAGNYDKLYQESADEWRNQVSIEDSRAKMQAMRDAMGKVKTRTLQTAREEQTSTAPVAGHSLTAFYQANFDKGAGMEAFVLVERGGRWYLAKYYVTSSGVKYNPQITQIKQGFGRVLPQLLALRCGAPRDRFLMN